MSDHGIRECLLFPGPNERARVVSSNNEVPTVSHSINPFVKMFPSAEYFTLSAIAVYFTDYSELMKPATKNLFVRLLEVAWLCALGVTLIFSALTTDRRARQVEENPSFCDPFGYLQTAQDIRHATAARTTPQFTVESRHTRLLVELMQSHHVPLPVWDEMVSPLACHYFPVADHVAVQYSPGAGLMLALFPEGRALHGLNRFVTIVFLLAGLVMLVVAAFKRRPLAAGLFIVALILGLEMLAQLDNASFSINALLVPLLLAGLCLTAAIAVQARSFYLAWSLTLFAGLLFGFAILARVPVVLLLPGVLLLLWPASLRSWYKSAWVPFISGVFLGGVLPVAIHQSLVAGAWYLPTYNHENADPPTLACVGRNISYYFGAGKSSTVNWVLPIIFAGCVGLICLSRRRAESGFATPFVRKLSWSRLLASALIILAVSNTYFLTHPATVHYYPWPGLFGAVLLLALGALALEHHSLSTMRMGSWKRRALLCIGLALSLSPGLIVMGRVWSKYIPSSTESMPKYFSLPAELADESAWVWACELSGTFWYYARKPAHKLTSTDPETRLLVYQFVIKRGEPQYIVTDDASMQAVADEIVSLGGTLERRGEVDGYPYFLIHWPNSLEPVKKSD